MLSSTYRPIAPAASRWGLRLIPTIVRIVRFREDRAAFSSGESFGNCSGCAPSDMNDQIAKSIKNGVDDVQKSAYRGLGGFIRSQGYRGPL